MSETSTDTLERLTTVIRRDLKLGPDVPVTPEMPFFGGDADIDSLDILLLLSSVEKTFGLRIPSEAVGREVFANVGTLVRYIDQHRASGGAAAGVAMTTATPSAAPDYLARLPHRDPFRFVSRVVTVREGDSAEAVWDVTGSEAFFAGHFPGHPVVPGVLIAEGLAQTAGLAAGVVSGQGRFAQVEVRFDRSVTPPAEIRLHARLARAMGALRQFDVAARVGDAVVAQGTVALGFAE